MGQQVSLSLVRAHSFSFAPFVQISLAGEILAQSLSQLERDIHPVVIISAYNKALKEALEIIKRISIPIDVNDDAQMLSLIKTSIGTKFVVRWSDLMCKLALEAVRTVSTDINGMKTVDIKRYARVEKIPGGEIEQSTVLKGVMVNKDITHPQMRRRIENPRIILLDCPLEYKKGESQTNMEFSKEGDWARAQEIEEEQVKALCYKLLEFKPDLIITEKGVSGRSAFFSPYVLPHCFQILHNTFSCSTMPLPCAECGNPTTTASRWPSVPPSSTESRTCASQMSAPNAGSSTLRKTATSERSRQSYKSDLTLFIGISRSSPNALPPRLAPSSCAGRRRTSSTRSIGISRMPCPSRVTQFSTPPFLRVVVRQRWLSVLVCIRKQGASWVWRGGLSAQWLMRWR